MLGDPDPGVRRELARAWLDAPDTQAIEPLFLDPDPAVRGALYAVRLLRGEWSEPPARYGVPPEDAMAALRDTLPVETLREIARNDREGARRQPAALALAVLRDEAAWTVMRTDPVWAIRDKVSRMLADGQDAGEGRQPA